MKLLNDQRHVHEYERMKLVRITRIENEHYQGVAGDKALLVRVCKCKAEQAFDYGSYKKMSTRLSQLKPETPGDNNFTENR